MFGGIEMARQNNHFWTERNTALIGLIVLIPFGVLGTLLVMNPIWLNQIDANLGALLHDRRAADVTYYMIGVTTLADFWSQAVFSSVITLILIAVRRWKEALWFAGTVVLGSGLLNDFMKTQFARVRPEYVDHLVIEGHYAFPSGHSMGSMILLGAVVFLVLRLWKKERLLHFVVIVFCAITVLAIGLSRIYLGVHYPSDVLGGFSLGAGWLFLSIAAFGLRAVK